MSVTKLFLKAILILSAGFFFVSCSDSKDVVPTENRDDSEDEAKKGNLVKVSQFSGENGYSVSGDVDLFYDSDSDTYSLILSNFSSSNGPDLKVYLSQGANPVTFLDLGDLKSTNGTLRYDFAGSDFNPAYDQVLIWCQQFSVNFGRGALIDP